MNENVKQKFNFNEMGAIFDMDGVIIDTCSLHESSWFEISKIYRFPWNKALNFRSDVFGTSSVDSATLLFGSAILGYDMREICSRKDEVYRELLHENIYDILIPGFMSFFTALLNSKIPVVLATSSIPSEAEFVLNSLAIYKHFKSVIDISKVSNPKPHPEIYLKACKALGLPGSKCVGFEDSLPGIRALEAAGVKCIAVGSTLSRDRLNQSGLKYELYIKDFSVISIQKTLKEKGEKYFWEVT